MRLSFRAFVFLSLSVVLAGLSDRALGQFNLPGLGQKSPASNDQKVDKLLHENLPLVLDANTAYPTVPNEDLLGGPFHGQVLPITLDTLTKPLPPGDYVLPMTFFCSEYSIHRPGAGTAYVLAPAKGTAAKAIPTLLWRGMLTGHKPQELQSVSWAIQGSVAYDKMPPNYKRLIDELIPDMKNQVNGQAFADIEDGFQGKVNRFTRKISAKATEGLGKVTGGRGRVDIKADVELNESFGRLGRLGQAALDGEKLSTVATAAYPTDEAREHALYAGQGTQAPPLPAANGPWSVIVPGVAYMRYIVHGGNLQGDNTMEIRIIRQGTLKTSNAKSHLVLAQYPQSLPTAPSLTGLVGGTVNQATLSQCFATRAQAGACVADATTVSGLMAYSVGTGAQASLSTPATPISQSPASSKVCVKKVLYQATDLYPDANVNSFRDAKKDLQNPSRRLNEGLGLCIYLAVVADDGKSCSGLTTAEVPKGEKLNWVRTFKDNNDIDSRKYCVGHPCKDGGPGPLYRPGTLNSIFEEGGDFDRWTAKLAPLGSLQLVFRDIPQRLIRADDPKNVVKQFDWVTANDYHPKSGIDNHLRLVSYKAGQDAAYTPLIEISYGLHFNTDSNAIAIDPLVIGGHAASGAMPEAIDYLRADYPNLPGACTNTDGSILGEPPDIPLPLP